MTQTLSTAQNITVFAPSNDAFTKLLQRNPNAAKLMNTPNLLTGVLQYHVLAGKTVANDFNVRPRFAQTMLAQPFANVTGGQKVELVKVNNAAMLFGGYKQASTVTTAVCYKDSILAPPVESSPEYPGGFL